jgi:DNA-binding LacI/PurR family transcriptional regulator
VKTPGRATQADVARHAGVSPAIVSAVVNDRQYGNIRISERTRLRVLESVRTLGYSPNIAARNLAGGTNRLVGVFSWQRLFPLLKEDFFYEFLVGIEEAAEDSGNNLLMLCAAKDETGARSLYPTGANGLQLADGGLLLGWDEKQDQIRRLQAEGYPFVFVGERHIEGVQASWVGADYFTTTAAIVDQLAELGHQRVGLLVEAGSPNDAVAARRAGFQAGAARHPSLKPQTATFDPGADSAGVLPDIASVLGWVRDRGLTAVVVESSRVAVELRTAGAQAGLSVPADLSLVGLSGRPELPGVESLTELSIPRREMGRESVRLLLELLAGTPGPITKTLPCAIRDAGTIAPPR